MSDLHHESLLRLLTKPVAGRTVVGFGDGSRSLLQVFAADAGLVTRVVTPDSEQEEGATGIERLPIERWNVLPFASASIALVALPPPVEWPRGRQARRQWLSEVRRILRDDGEILLIAPNRFGHKRLRRRLRGRVEDAALSLPAYRRWLRDGGFGMIECFGLRRDRAGLVTGVTPVGPVSTAWSLPPPGSTKDRIKRWLGLANELALRASPGDGAVSIAGDLVGYAAGKLGISVGSLTIHRLFASAKGKGFLVVGSGSQRWLVRICLTESAKLASERHMCMLQRARRRVGAADWLPEIIATGRVSGFECQLEHAMPGQALRHHVADEGPAGYLDQLQSVMQQLNPFDPNQTPVRLDGERFRSLVEGPLDRVFARAGAGTEKARFGAFLERQLRGMSYLPGLVHGDLSLSNILVADRRICGLIDWDDAREDDIPVHDAISHLLSRELHRLRRRAYAEVLGRLAFGDWPVPEEQAFLEAMYRHCRISTVHHPGLVCLNWLHTADSRLAESSGGSSGGHGGLVRQFVSEVIDRWVDSGQLQ